MEYEKTHGKISTQHEQDMYDLWLNGRAKQKLDKLQASGYDIDSISKYASKSYKLGNYFETYTEYRVKERIKCK